ncbi:MAG: hypothetical protein J3R72DRAFT_97947 [Linnemannia gamsii]|nr:MAG: hypothetical protein J3R72DRAFT_97947 [Linnemannia gamsii]
MTTTTSTEPASWPSPSAGSSSSSSSSQQKSASISRLDIVSSDSISTVVPSSIAHSSAAHLDILADPTHSAALDPSFHPTSIAEQQQSKTSFPSNSSCTSSPTSTHFDTSFVSTSTSASTATITPVVQPLDDSSLNTNVATTPALNTPLNQGTTVHKMSLPFSITHDQSVVEETIRSPRTQKLVNASHTLTETGVQETTFLQREVLNDQSSSSSSYPLNSSRMAGRVSMDSGDHKDIQDHHETVSTTSFSIEESAIAYTEMDMSMTSPTRHTKSPPTSTSSSLSSTGRRRMIAESSMILSGGAGQAAISSGAGIGGGGALSPAWSMTSIPRDISANYCRNAQDDSTGPVIAPMDEKLYGLVDRYGFLVEEGRTPTADRKSGQTSSSSRTSVRPTKETK